MSSRHGYTGSRTFPMALSELQYRMEFKHSPEIRTAFNKLAAPIYKAAKGKMQNINMRELLRIEAQLLEDAKAQAEQEHKND